jgi:hypothetical protein
MTPPPPGRARGTCPRCGRLVTGRAVPVEAAPADRRYVVLTAHVRDPRARTRHWCVTRTEYVKVPRWRPAPEEAR